jgi:hypothetical protein
LEALKFAAILKMLALINHLMTLNGTLEYRNLIHEATTLQPMHYRRQHKFKSSEFADYSTPEFTSGKAKRVMQTARPMAISDTMRADLDKRRIECSTLGQKCSRAEDFRYRNFRSAYTKRAGTFHFSAIRYVC